MLKLIVSDLDGTLLPKGEERLCCEVFDMIARAQKRGISFAVASGRAYYELKRFFRGACDGVYYMASDGALTVCREKNLSTAEVPKTLLRQTFSAVQRMRIPAVVFTGKYLSYYMSWDKTFHQRFCRERHGHILSVESVAEVKEPIFKLSFYGTRENMFSDLTRQLSLVYQDENWMDFVVSGIHKGKALQNLCKDLKIAPEEVLAFGDNDNDVSMLEWVPNSFAMTHGSRLVRDVAKMQTDSVVHTVTALLNGNLRS